MITHRSNMTKVLIISGIFFMLLSVTNLLANEPDVKYVEVFQKNGNIDKFEFDTFTMSWILPITLRKQVTREDVEIKKEEFEEIYIVGKFSNGWDEDKEDWGVTVYLLDKREMLGFFHVSEFLIKGVLSHTGEEKSIPFEDVKKIVFKR